MYQYLALTSLRESPFAYKPHSSTRPPIGDFFSSLPNFRFRTSVSVLRFPFQRFPLARVRADVWILNEVCSRLSFGENGILHDFVSKL